MVIPRKINFGQMGCNSDSCEQRFHQLFEREYERMGFNISLMDSRFEKNSRKAIAIDANFFTKSGKRLLILGSLGRGVTDASNVALKFSGLESLTLSLIIV